MKAKQSMPRPLADALIARIKSHGQNVKCDNAILNTVYRMAHDHIIEIIEDEFLDDGVEEVKHEEDGSGIKTNRDWLNSLTNKQLAEFLTCGLYVHNLYKIEGNLPEGVVFVRDRCVNLKEIKSRYIQSHTVVEQWLNSPQEFEVISEAD